jgi:hypothetical protein
MRSFWREVSFTLEIMHFVGHCAVRGVTESKWARTCYGALRQDRLNFVKVLLFSKLWSLNSL